MLFDLKNSLENANIIKNQLFQKCSVCIHSILIAILIGGRVRKGQSLPYFRLFVSVCLILALTHVAQLSGPNTLLCDC